MSNMVSEALAKGIAVGVSTGRDIEITRYILGKWLLGQMPEATAVEVRSLEKPKSSGASSETYFVAVDVFGGREVDRRDYVLRFKPEAHRLFLRDNFEQQYRLLNYLAAETDVPLPAIPFYEPEGTLLGGPFYLMERVEGLVPPDSPLYNTAGFVFEATPEQQRKLWSSGLQAAAKLARLDWRKLPRIVDLRPGESGLEENLRHWMDSMEWASGGNPTSLLLGTADWLRRNIPAERGTGLSWGDCRIGNMIFRDFECAAIIDWETITLAGPQLDLAHWLVMEDWYTFGLGGGKLPGIGDRADTVAYWEELTGLKADALEWHEVLAAFRLAVITTRGSSLKDTRERSKASHEDGYTMMARQLCRVLARVAPGLV